ncbi:MAG: NADH-quinone oxidoreductase subunit NuoG [Deinococcota bacterium]
MKVKVNEIELDLPAGTSAIDAVFQAGYDVPYFCSQEYMSPIGACRLCLAKVGAPRKDRGSGEWILDEETGEPKIFWFPKPMATCTTAVMEGMVIDTKCEETKRAQKSMMEFTLINHPLDCPVCDKGGACELQDRAYEYGDGVSRFAFDKRHQEKHHALSPLITLDRERCIHCKRCVRYFEEIPGDEVLDFIERGGHTYIGTLDDGLPSNFTGNITDICPVGALLDSTSRFRGRNWEYRHTRTTSTDDSSGSSIMVDSRTGRIERVKAARHTKINHDWLDDGTRFGHEYVDAPERLKTPLIKEDGQFREASWEEASSLIAERLQAASSVGVAVRADATLEEAVGAHALAKALNGAYDYYPKTAASVVPDAPQATFDDLATSDAILVISDLTEEVPIADLRVKDALKGVTPPEPMAHGIPIADLRLKEHMPKKTDILTVAGPYHVDLMIYAGRKLTYDLGHEVALLSALLNLAQGKDAEVAGLGADRDSLNPLVNQLKDSDNAVIAYGSWVLGSAEATSLVNDLAEAVDAKLLPLAPMANSRGLELIDTTGDNVLGSASALLLSNLNPAQDTQLKQRLEGLEFLVVHDCFMTETAELADVILPAKTGYEKEGTIVNLEGRMLPLTAVDVDGGGSEDLTGVVKALGDALGSRLDGRSVRSARRKLKADWEIDLAELPSEGVLPDESLSNHFQASTASSSPADVNVVIVPTMVRPEYLAYNPSLETAHGALSLRVHPDDANKYGLPVGERVKLDVSGVTRYLVVKEDNRVAPGLALVPALPEQPLGLAFADLQRAERAPLATPKPPAPVEPTLEVSA